MVNETPNEAPTQFDPLRRRTKRSVTKDTRCRSSPAPAAPRNHIAIPEAGRLYLSGTTIPAIGAKFVQRPDGIIDPETVARGPRPIDLIKTYVTYSELFGHPPYPDYIVEALGAVPRLDFVRLCASVLGLYEKLGASRRDVDRQLAEVCSRTREGHPLRPL